MFDELLGSINLVLLSLLSDAKLVHISALQRDRHINNFETDHRTIRPMWTQLCCSMKTAPYLLPLVNATPVLVQGDRCQSGPYPYCADGALNTQDRRRSRSSEDSLRNVVHSRESGYYHVLGRCTVYKDGYLVERDGTRQSRCTDCLST